MRGAEGPRPEGGAGLGFGVGGIGTIAGGAVGAPTSVVKMPTVRFAESTRVKLWARISLDEGAGFWAEAVGGAT